MLHPQARAALAAEIGQIPVTDPSVDLSAIVKRREEARRLALEEPREEIGEVIDGDADGVPIRIYLPEGSGGPLPAVVHLHGGGFVFGDVDVHDAAVRRLVNRAGLAAVSVDYRRAPEHRYPAALRDVETVLAWLPRQGTGHGLDPGRLLLHGDSAGANLALVSALHHPGTFQGMALTYPFVDAHQRGASYDEAPGMFDREAAAWYWRQYASGPADYDDPDFSPIDAPDLAGLPPTLVVTGEHDPLRDEGELLAIRIAEAGVSCVATRYLGMLHGFWRDAETFDASKALTRQLAAFLAEHAGLRRG